MADDHYCIHTADFGRLENLIGQVFAKMDAFITDMRTIMVEDARNQEKISAAILDIKTIKADMESLADAKVVETLQAEVTKLVAWKHQFAGSIRMLLAVPSVCTFVVTVLHLWGYLHGG